MMCDVTRQLSCKANHLKKGVASYSNHTILIECSRASDFRERENAGSTRYPSSLVMATQAAKRALNVVVFLGTVRENNMGSRAAKFMVNQLSAKGHQVKLLGKVWGIVVSQFAMHVYMFLLVNTLAIDKGNEGVINCMWYVNATPTSLECSTLCVLL